MKYHPIIDHYPRSFPAEQARQTWPSCLLRYSGHLVLSFFCFKLRSVAESDPALIMHLPEQTCTGSGLTGIVIGLPINPMEPSGSLTDPETDSRVARRCRELANTVAVLAAGRGIEVYL